MTTQIENNARLYVGNLPFATTEDEVRKLFGAYGTVKDVKVCTDRETGKSKGFGFVEMATPAEADFARKELHRQDFEGRDLTVAVADPKPAKGSGGGGRTSAPREDRGGGGNRRGGRGGGGRRHDDETGW